ncbi:unnamed protein product [Closterium sp. NIES-54]
MTADHARLLKLHDRRRLLRLQGKSTSAKTGVEGGAVRAGTGDWTIGGNAGNGSLAEGTVTEVGGGAFYQLGGNMEMTIAGLYWAEVQLGQPVQKFQVQIDTGSDVMWVTCAPCLACPVASTVVRGSLKFARYGEFRGVRNGEQLRGRGLQVMWVTCAPCLACPVASTVVRGISFRMWRV